MSSIPPPSYDTHSKYDVGGYPPGGATGTQDPYGLGGGGAPGGTGEAYQTPQMQAYVQQLYYYHQMYSQMLNTATDPNQISQLRQYDSQVTQYLQEVGAPPPGSPGDPYAQNPLGGAPGQTPLDPNAPVQQQYNFPVSYQTKDSIMTDEGPTTDITVNQHDADTRRIDVYQPTNTLEIPSNAANVTYNEATDDASGDPHKMLTVTITFKNPDGSTSERTVVYHNVDRSNFGLGINTPSEEQITDLDKIPDDLKGKLAWGKAPAPEQLQGDPPTKMDGDTRIYDGQDFNISPVPSGDHKTTEVKASGDVTITPNSNDEYYVVKYDDSSKSYQVLVYKSGPPADDKNLKETINIDGNLVNNINFTCDPSRIEFKGSLGKTDGGNQINDKDDNGAKLHLTGAEGEPGIHAGAPMNPNAPSDTPIDDISNDGKTATINTASSVELTNYPPPKGPSTVNITTNGPVVIHKQSYDDKVAITKVDDNTYQIVVTDKDGKNAVTYNVRGSSGLDLDFLPANATYASSAKATPVAFTSDLDSKIKVEGATAAPTKYPDFINNLHTLTGAKPEDIVAALESTYTDFPRGGDPQAINTWLNDFVSKHTPPDTNMLIFLSKADPEIGTLLGEISGKNVTDPQVSQKLSNIADLLVGELNDVYGGGFSKGTINTISFFGGIAGAPTSVPGIEYNGKTYNVFNVDKNTLMSGTLPTLSTSTIGWTPAET